MKARLTEKFYKKYQDRLFEKYKNECDFEYELKIYMMGLDTLPEETRKLLETAYAKEVYDTATKKLVEKMRMIKEIEAGRASLGYINESQGWTALHDLNEGFEFSCFMLAEFKKKYDI